MATFTRHETNFTRLKIRFSSHGTTQTFSKPVSGFCWLRVSRETVKLNTSQTIFSRQHYAIFSADGTSRLADDLRQGPHTILKQLEE